MLAQILSLIEAKFSGISNEPAFAMGAKYLHAHGTPPRVIWVPFDEPVKEGQLQDDSLAVEYNAIATRSSSLEAHVWGASFAQTEALVHNLITAWRDVLTGCGKVLSVRWPQQGEVGWVENGFSSVVQLNVDIPVMDTFVSIPDAPDPAENADGATVVTVVSSSPGENETTISRGDTTYDVDPLD